MKKFILFLIVLCISTQNFAQTQIIQYEYWFNDDYANAISVAVSPTDTLDLNTFIPIGNLSVGLNKFNIRFKDDLGQWSSTLSQCIVKSDVQKNDSNQLVSYEYWFNDSYANAVKVNVAPSDTLSLFENIDISTATKATNAVHFRFKDKYDVWSSVNSTNFYRPVEADFTHIAGLAEVAFTNTSKYADTYRWTFGDGTTSTQVNPQHAYFETGEYNVQLIASNLYFRDTVSYTVKKEVVGTIDPRKGGNDGFVSINIYGGGLDTSTIVQLVKNSDTISTYRIYKKEPGVICVTFDLTDKDTGLYDIIVTINGTEYVFENEFTIEEARYPEAFAEIQGNNIFIAGRWQTYTVNYGNLGNTDIYGLPINLIFSDISEVEFLFNLIDTVGGDSTDINDTENYVELTSLYGESFNGRMYSVLVPHIPAGTSSSFPFRVKVNTESATKMYVNTGDILNYEYFNTQEEEIESDELFGYTLTDNFKIKIEDISQLIRYEIDKSFQNPQTTSKKSFVNFTKLLETSDGFVKKQKDGEEVIIKCPVDYCEPPHKCAKIYIIGDPPPKGSVQDKCGDIAVYATDHQLWGYNPTTSNVRLKMKVTWEKYDNPNLPVPKNTEVKGCVCCCGCSNREILIDNRPPDCKITNIEILTCDYVDKCRTDEPNREDCKRKKQ